MLTMLKAGPRSSSIALWMGVIAAPIFIGAFTIIGARRTGYDWRRHAVSSLGAGHPGWPQRSNFILTGFLYLIAEWGLAPHPRRSSESRLVGIIVGAVGVGLIGSGIFVTDPVGGFPPPSSEEADKETPALARTTQSRSGKLHNLFAIPIFVGIPMAGVLSTISSARRGKYGWASYSLGSSVVMVASFLLFGSAFGGSLRLDGKGGIFQRISVTTGFGWLSALSLRQLATLNRS